jgi:hypothetical protein
MNRELHEHACNSLPARELSLASVGGGIGVGSGIGKRESEREKTNAKGKKIPLLPERRVTQPINPTERQVPACRSIGKLKTRAGSNHSSFLVLRILHN